MPNRYTNKHNGHANEAHSYNRMGRTSPNPSANSHNKVSNHNSQRTKGRRNDLHGGCNNSRPRRNSRGCLVANGRCNHGL